MNMRVLLDKSILFNSYILLFSIPISIPLTRICIKLLLILLLIKILTNKPKLNKYDILPLIMPAYQIMNALIHKTLFDFLRKPNGLIPVGTFGLKFIDLDIEKALKFFTLGGLFLSLGIIFQSLLGISDYRNIFRTDINLHLSIIRPWHTFVGHPLTAGALISISLFLSLTFYLITKYLRYLILTLIFLIAVVLTFDRSYWLATVCSYFVYIVILNLRRPNKNFLMSLVVLILIVISLTSFKPIKERVLLIFNYKRDNSSLYRIAMWKGALNYYKISSTEDKLFGIGGNKYTEELKVSILKEEEKLRLHPRIFSHLHSDFITTLVWYGIVGLLIFLITFLTLIFINLKAFYNTDNLLFLFFSVAYIVVLLGGIFEYNFEDEAVKYLIYALFGLNIKLIEKSKVL